MHKPSIYQSIYFHVILITAPVAAHSGNPPAVQQGQTRLPDPPARPLHRPLQGSWGWLLGCMAHRRNGQFHNCQS